MTSEHIDLCETCGGGYYLPSGHCDHCDSRRKVNYDALLSALVKFQAWCTDNRSLLSEIASLTARLAEATALCASLQEIIDGHTSEEASVVAAFHRLENGEGLSLDEFFDKQNEAAKGGRDE